MSVGADEMPLLEMLQVLSRTPVSEAQLRAVVAVTCGRWCAARGEDNEALRLLAHALELVPDLRPAMRLLYRIYLRRGDVRSAVRYLDQEIRATRHPREAAALYRERGKLVETHFGDRNAALQCYQAALKATPRDLAILRSVETIALHRGDVFGLIANLEQQVEVLHDPPAVAGVLRDLAVLETRRGGDLPLAVDMLAAALDESKSHLGLAQDLARVAELASDPEMVLRGLEAEADALPPERRGGPLARASALLRDAKERVAAVSLLHAAALAQPHVLGLWRSLEEVGMASARYDAAVAACLGQLRAIGDNDVRTRAELYYRIGRLAMIRLDRVGEGLAAMRKALRLDPTHVPALEDSGRYLITNQAWSQLLELLRTQVANAEGAGQGPEERAQGLLRAGQVMEEHVRELESARQIYEEAAAICPTFRPAIDRLERILHQLGRLDALRDLYQAELGRTKETSRRLFLLAVLGQLAARDADPALAIKYHVALLKDLPEHLTSLQSLARLLARAGRTKELLTVTEQEIRLTPSASRRAKLLHRAAELALEQGNREHAYECLRSALAAADDHEASIDLLDAMLREDSDDHELAQLIRRRLEHTADRERRVALLLELANLLANRLHDRDAALAEIDTLLAAWPGHLPALHVGERLAVDLRRWRLLVKMLQEHVQAARSARTRALLLYRLAHVRSRELGDHGPALLDLRAALQLWPQLGVARALLLDLSETAGDAATLRAAALDGLKYERSPVERQALALRLAAHTFEPELAIQYLDAAAAAAPGDASTQLRLARAARASSRPALAARAFAAAAASITAAGESPHALALRYLAASAQSRAGDVDGADAAFATLSASPSIDLLARRARERLRAGAEPWERAIDHLLHAAEASEESLERAAFLTRMSQLLSERGDEERALEAVTMALGEAPDYLPARFVLAELEERLGQSARAIAELERIAERLQDAGPRAEILCRAGVLALGDPSLVDGPALAWHLFGRALHTAPASELAFNGLWQTLRRHGPAGAPLLADPLGRRLDILARTGALGGDQLRALAHVAFASDGPRIATSLLEKGIALAGFDAPVYVELARGYAHLDRWVDAIPHLHTALDLEPSPERKAAIHFFLAEAHERSGSREPAIRHYVAASQGGHHPRHSLAAAERLAAEIGSLGQRIDALRLLVDIGDVGDKLRGLRALAEVYAGPREEPLEAIGHLRHLLRLEPTDFAAIARLRGLLVDLDRPEEARAALVAGIAAHRTALRHRGLRSRTGEQDAGLVAGLHRLFDATQELGGVYTCAAILEVIDPRQIPAGRDCDTLHGGTWPLPLPREDNFAALASGKDATVAAFLLLREGLGYLTEIPGSPEAPQLIQGRLSLPSASAVASVTRALAQALGVPEPDVYLNPNDEASVLAWGSGTPALIVGRKINATPNSALAREKIGRALLRVALGGDHVVQRMPPAHLVGLLAGLAESVGVRVDFRQDLDEEIRDRVIDILSTGAASLDYGDHVERLARAVDTFDPTQLRAAFVIAEDRSAVLCAGDPRGTIRDLRRTGALTSARGQALLSYLLSDDHLSLRRALGYSIEVELDIDDVEEIP